jgi:hypothetical protein
MNFETKTQFLLNAGKYFHACRFGIILGLTIQFSSFRGNKKDKNFNGSFSRFGIIKRIQICRRKKTKMLG